MQNNRIPDTVAYICGILDERTKTERLIRFHSPAATNKVVEICTALKTRVNQVVILSTGRGKQSGNRLGFKSTARRISGVPVLYGAFWQLPLVTHIVTTISLISLLFRLRKGHRPKEICLIAYNRKWHYLPMLLVARFLGIRCFLDLEDGALTNSGGLRHRLISRIGRLIFDHVCNQGVLLASVQLISQASQKNHLVCYGVINGNLPDAMSDVKTTAKIRFLYGGSLLQETGTQLLIDFIHLIEKKNPALDKHIQFVITGYGKMADDLERLSRNEGRRWMEYYGMVDKLTYNKLLDSAHVGICLKLPSSEMLFQTFPSKVVEYASYGKAVLSTPIKDVVDLFRQEGAFFLQEESADDLLRVIEEIVFRPEQITDVARQGYLNLYEKLNRQTVADQLVNFLSR